MANGLISSEQATPIVLIDLPCEPMIIPRECSVIIVDWRRATDQLMDRVKEETYRIWGDKEERQGRTELIDSFRLKYPFSSVCSVVENHLTEYGEVVRRTEQTGMPGHPSKSPRVLVMHLQMQMATVENLVPKETTETHA